MVKIITKNTASTFNTDSNKTAKTSYKTATVFERNITTEVKGIKTILSNTEKSIGEIKKTLTSIAKKPFSGGFNSGFGDLYGATEEHEDNRKQKATYAVNNSIKALHKDLISLLGLRKTDNKPKEDNFITRLFKKIFSLSNLFRAALATLPFIFKDTISALIGKGLEKLGVDKELAAKVAHYLTPAIQGAGIGYLLFRNWKGIVAGAVVGVGYTMIQDMIDEWKNNTKDKSNDNVRRIEGLGTLTKDVLIGAGIGFGLSGVKGMIAGAVVGAVVGSVKNLITQWDQNVNQPEQKTTSQHFANLGEGAFYGPKLEFTLRDAIGREWQCGTFQVDFNLGERLGAEYIDVDGSKKHPVMLHRAILGSFERFIAILIENFAGNLPIWLAPVQAVVIGVSNEFDKNVVEIAKQLQDAGIRCTYDLSGETVSYKVRKHSEMKIPYIITIGKKEVEEGTLSVRKFGENKNDTMKVEELVRIIKE